MFMDVLYKNMFKSIFHRSPVGVISGDFHLKSMSLANAFQSISLFNRAFAGESYGLIRSLFLITISRRFSLCAIDKNGRLVGFEIFRLGSRDIVEGTIHESFIAVHPEYSGMGIATRLRKFAINSLRENGFNGISSRIALSNSGSLISAEKVGFKPVEEYVNDDNQREVYLVLGFDAGEHD